MAQWRNSSYPPETEATADEEARKKGKRIRCGVVVDLTALGVCSSLGAGAYVALGGVARGAAGPAAALAVLLAGAAAALAGLCYAELNAWMPSAGSAYTYTEFGMGKFIAFVAGWNMLLDHLLGSGVLSRGISVYVDMLAGGAISEWFKSFAPLTGPYLADYFDFLAFFLVLVMGVLLAIDMKVPAIVMNILASVNLLVILFVIVAGALHADPRNWQLSAPALPDDAGAGGFFPRGARGVLQGAAICFYCFVGFEAVCHNDTKAGGRSVRLSLALVVATSLLACGGVAVVLTMMVPYYLQDRNTSVADVFQQVGWPRARWGVAVGAVVGMITSMWYTASSAGRLHRGVTRGLRGLRGEGPRGDGPRGDGPRGDGPRGDGGAPQVWHSLLMTAVMAVLAGLLNLQQILMMMSFGSLLLHTIVAAEVIVLRYQSKEIPEPQHGVMKRVLGIGMTSPTKQSYTAVIVALSLFILASVVSAVMWTWEVAAGAGGAGRYWAGGAGGVAAVLLAASMALHPQNKLYLEYKTPLVPLIPCISIFCNIHLMALIGYQTWIRNAIWLIIGLIIYAICSIKYRKQKTIDENKTHIDQNGNMATVISTKQTSDKESINDLQDPPEIKVDKDDVIETYADFEGQIKQLNVQQSPEREKTELVMLQAIIETNEEKEAKIIDLLDKVLQAEEDTYGEITIIPEHNFGETTPSLVKDDHRQSLGDISDAGSDASFGIQVLSKYDVVAQVHREDMPRLCEEEEKQYSDETEEQEVIIQFEQGQEYDQNDSEFNGSETNSRTDESGYSDTIYKSTVNNSTEDTSAQENIPYIPTPPPMDESFFAKPAFRKSYSMVSKSPKTQLIEINIEKPRKSIQSIQSNGSLDDGHIVFGSDKQMNFMSKLNNIFQTKILTDGVEPRVRSNSLGDVAENKELSTFKPPAIFADLKKELLSKDPSQTLRPVNIEIVNAPVVPDDEEDTDTSLNRSELKSKLETLYANGGLNLMKPRFKKSSTPAPTPEADTSSPESVPKLPQIEKNDTLKRQKDKFGDVLNALRLGVNNNDVV